MAKVSAGMTASINAHADLAAFPIYKFGTDAQREAYLPRSIAGEIIGALRKKPLRAEGIAA